jgi:Tol biopolymer transport system component
VSTKTIAPTITGSRLTGLFHQASTIPQLKRIGASDRLGGTNQWEGMPPRKAPMRCLQALVALPLAAFALGGLAAAPRSAAESTRLAAGYRIVFASNRDGVTRAYSMLPDGSRLTPLLPSSKALVPAAVSGDGGTVAYEGRKSLYVSRADGTALRRLMLHGGQAVLSRDGRLLAFSDERGISIIGSDGRGLRRIASSGSTPDWSPDRTTLAFTRWRNGGPAVVVVDSSSKRQRVVARHAYSPEWSPDGRWIAYVSHGIALVHANGTQPRRVYRAKADVGEFAWSPNGKRIALIVRDASQDAWVVAVVGIKHGAVKQLHLAMRPRGEGAVTNSGLRWSPDGRLLTLAGHSGDDPDQIWLVGSDGRGLRRVTNAGDNRVVGWTRRAPVLPPAHALPRSERVLGSRTIATSAPVTSLSADGSRVAFIGGATAGDCDHVAVWRPATKSILRLSRLRAPCREFSQGRMAGLQLAGSRAAWAQVSSCGNDCYFNLVSATFGQRVPVPLAFAASDGYGESPDFGLHGDGDLFVFNDSSRLVRIGAGRESCANVGASWAPDPARICSELRSGEHTTAVDSVAGGLISIRERDAVAVLDDRGQVVKLFPFAPDEVKTALLDGGRLVVARLAVLESYDIASGAREGSRRLPSGYRLTDVDGGVAVLRSDTSVMLLSLANGRSYTLPHGADLADLEPPGLYYSYPTGEGRVVFMPRVEVLRRLGGKS